MVLSKNSLICLRGKFMKVTELIQENIADCIGNFVEHVLKDVVFYQKDEGNKFQVVPTFQKEFNLWVVTL